MKSKTKTNAQAIDRKGERGAALLTVLLVSVLLLSAGLALVTSTSLSTTTAIDATAEMQAYSAAEAGIEATLNVLRGNVAPDSSLSGTKIDFRNAVQATTSNKAGDPVSVSRLSGWLNYSYQNPSATNDWRVPLSSSYSPLTGLAFNMAVTDPDNSNSINFSTAGQFTPPIISAGATATVSNNPATLAIDVAGVRLTMVYEPRSATSVVAYPPVSSDLGTIRIVRADANLNLDLDSSAFTVKPKFNILVNQTAPWNSWAVLSSTMSGRLVVASNGTIVTNTLALTFNNASAKSHGATYALASSLVNLAYPAKTLPQTVAALQPERLLLQATGHGPKGAVKRLEMIVKRSAFDLATPGTITLVGGSSIGLSLGASNANCYSGADHANPPASGLPAVTVSPGNLTGAQTVINNLNGTSGSTAPSPCAAGSQVAPCAAGSLTSSNTPSFLQSADAARAFLNEMKALGTDMNRLFPDQDSAIAAGGLGTTTSPKFTLIDNYGTSTTAGALVNLGSGHQGSGLLIVTGDIETNGNTDFEGVILVLGRGHITRSGGGNGTIKGTVIVANFDPNGAPGDPFGSPVYSISGGGNSCIHYDSSWVERALDATGIGVIGVREYH